MKHLLHNKVIISLILITAIGGFFRAFHYADWTHYQLDQARDFRVILAATKKGPGELPLQGPKAAGNVYIDSDGDGEAEDKTTLRLGPLFYYMEYVSALIFGATPAGSTMIILLLSILTIPLFYFFAREFFPERLALILTIFLNTSLYFIIYSRFGWNPNLIPFFALLTSYSLLRASDEKSSQKSRGLWFIGAAAAFAFLANMHFLAFTVFPVITLAYLIWTRPHIRLMYWFGAVLVFVTLNTPLIINDLKTGGENYKAFLASVTGSSTEETSLARKLARNTFEHSQMAWVVLTSDQDISVPKVKKSGPLITCDDTCKKSGLKTLLVLLTAAAGCAAWVFLVRRVQEPRPRNFLRLTGLWAIITFIIHIPLAFDVAPRFFLLQAPLFIIFLGFVAYVITLQNRRWPLLALNAIILTLLFVNAIFVSRYFHELRTAPTDSTFKLDYSDLILKEKTRVTREQMEDIVREMISIHGKNKEPIFMEAQAEYKRAFWERIENYLNYKPRGVGDLRTPYAKGNYFIVLRTQSDFDNYFKKFEDTYNIESTKSFGTLTLYTLSVKNTSGLDDYPTFEKRVDPQFSTSAQVRYLWRQVIEGCTYNYTFKKCEK